jgi:hypothetical protein
MARRLGRRCVGTGQPIIENWAEEEAGRDRFLAVSNRKPAALKSLQEEAMSRAITRVILFLLVAVGVGAEVWPAAAQTPRQIVALATVEAAAPVPSRFDYFHLPVGVSDSDVVAIADGGGVSLSTGTAVASFGDLVPGVGLLGDFATPATNVRGDVVFLATSFGGPLPGRGLFLASQGQIALLTRLSGDPSPDGTPFGGGGDLALNNQGWVGFGAVTQRGAGLFLYADGVLRKAVGVGDAAPGGGTFTALGPPTRPALNDLGEIAFIASTSTGSTQLLVLSPDGTFRSVAKTGDPLPGGGTIARFTASDSDALVDLNNQGDVAFFASPPSTVQGGVYLSSGGTLRKIVAANDAAPIGGTFTGFGGCCYEGQLGLNDNGDVSFYAWLNNSSLQGIFLSSGGTIRKVAVLGDPAPGGGTLLPDLSRHALSDSGAIAFSGYLNPGSNVSQAVFLGRPDGTLALIARRGDPAPTRPAYRSFTVAGGAMNGAGSLVFHAEVAGGAVFLSEGGTIQPVASAGDSAPGGGRIAEISPYNPPTINAAGEVAFIAEFEGDGDDRAGVFAGPPGALRRIAAQGDPSPTGGQLGYFIDRPVIDDAGGVTFVAYTDSGQALFRAADGTLHAIAATFSRGYPLPLAGKRVRGYLAGFDANAAGEIAFSTVQNYRGRIWLAAAGRVSAVVRGAKQSPFAAIGAVALNAQRQIAFAGGPDYANDVFLAVGRHVVSVADADVQQRPDLNDLGEVVYFDSGPAGEGVYRWRDGVAEAAAVLGDATPLGTIIDFNRYDPSFATGNRSEVALVADVVSDGISRDELLVALP